MKAGRMMRGLVGAVVLWGVADSAEARSLSDEVNLLFGERGIELTEEQISGVPHRSHFTSDSLATLGLLVKQLAPSAADFPAISTVPGFTYRYNPQTTVFERSSTSLGPVFVERPQTLGRGQFDVGVSYLFVNFTELEGKDLDRLSFRGLRHNDCCNAAQPPPSTDFPAFERDTADLFFQQFNLRSHVASFFATYGITDRWDVNILVPVVFTSLELRARAQLNNESGTNTHFFDLPSARTAEVRSTDEDKFGVGDLLLRSKYHVFESEGFNAAFGATLRVPTGDEDNFQGIGDTTLTPFLAWSLDYGRFINLHASTGMEVNFDDWDRSRARYAAGVTVQIVKQFALILDVIGSTNVTTNRISVRVPQFVNGGGNSEGTPTTIPTSRVVSDNISTDVLDLAIGFKVNLFGSVVGFFNVFVPLNDDGLRADVIPAAGVEVSF